MIGRKAFPSVQADSGPKGFDDYELRLGDVMRGERATLGKSLLDVQRDLKIKASYIAAIENADMTAFETPGFVAGYVRSYARYLGMDPDWAFRRFCEESGFDPDPGIAIAGRANGGSAQRRKTAQRGVGHDPLANPNAVFVPRGEPLFDGIQPGAIGSILVLIALIGGIGYGGWKVLQEVQKVTLAPVDQAPGVVADIGPLAGISESLPATSVEDGLGLQDSRFADADPVTADAFDRLYRPEALDVPVLVERDAPIATIDPRTVGLLVARDDVVDEGEQGTLAVAENAPVQDPSPQVVQPGPPGVELLAVRPAWVRVTAADGSILLEKILDAGERFAIPPSEEPPTLRVGESGALYFVVAGQTYGPVGKRGVVTKNVVLAPDAVTETYAVADIAQDSDLAQFVAVADASDTAAQQTAQAPAQ
ncbi:helix-turn-helix domain-containing protein [Albidovulum inexpectatum]|nr:helix-turn-helix domain-containing protein [Albidovulum inexpectatum]